MCEIHCLACNNLIKHPKRIISFSGVSIIVCDYCHTWNYLPRGDPKNQVIIHDTSDYFDHEYFKNRRTISEITLNRCKRVFYRVSPEFKKRAVEGMPVLDVGCDTGSFIEGFSYLYRILPHGIDVSHRSIDIAKKKGIVTHCGTIDSAPKEMSNYSLITLIDVIEHVVDPAGLLLDTYQRLGQNGIVYLETPNNRSLVFLLGRILSKIPGEWKNSLLMRLFPPQHLMYLSEKGIRELALKSSFRVVRMGTQKIPNREINCHLIPFIIINVLQKIDQIFRREIIIWVVLKKGIQ